MARIGKFVILKRIGGGKHAEVYKVRHEKGYVCAIKVFKDTIDSFEDKKYTSFMNEWMMLKKIGNGLHPNIIRIGQAYVEEGRMFYEMDLVHGVTLQQYVEKTKFIPMDMVHTFIKDVVGAIAFCHHDIYEFQMDKKKDHLTVNREDGGKVILDEEKIKYLIHKYAVIHNDLHSGNIMLRTYDRHFDVLDFGLAIQEDNCVKYSGRWDGAIEFTAPEKLWPSKYQKPVQIVAPVGEGRETGGQDMPTAQADVYSLGILMYQMLAGRLPFILHDKTPESQSFVINAHLTMAPPSIEPLRREAFEMVNRGEKYVKDYPEWLEDIIMKCLSKQPEDRYMDAKALLDDYLAHLQEDMEKVAAAPLQADKAAAQVAALKQRVSSLTEEKEELMANIDGLKEENEKLHESLLAMQTETTSPSDGSWLSRNAYIIIAMLIGVASMLAYNTCASMASMNPNLQEQIVNP